MHLSNGEIQADGTDVTSDLVGLFDHFEGWRPRGNEDRINALKTGLVVIDTNVLLDLYRFGEDVRGDLLKALFAIRERLFVPHQVVHEFFDNRISASLGYKSELTDFSKSVESLGSSFIGLARRFGLSDGDRESFTDHFNKAQEALEKLTDSIRGERAWADQMPSSDPILAEVEELLSGRVGSPYDADRLDELFKEGEARYKSNTPPGFKDRRKSIPYGDFIVWRQLLDHASSVDYETILFVSNDVKEDWILKVGGRDTIPLPALTEESLREAKATPFLGTVSQFMRLANEHLNAGVSASSVAVAEELEQEDQKAPESRLQLKLPSGVATTAFNFNVPGFNQSYFLKNWAMVLNDEARKRNEIAARAIGALNDAIQNNPEMLEAFRNIERLDLSSYGKFVERAVTDQAPAEVSEGLDDEDDGDVSAD